MIANYGILIAFLLIRKFRSGERRIAQRVSAQGLMESLELDPHLGFSLFGLYYFSIHLFTTRADSKVILPFL